MRVRVGKQVVITFVLALSGCSTDFTSQTCSVDSDCGDGLVCELRDQTPVCIAAADAPIMLGHHSALSGTNQALGTNMKLGIELAIKEKNEAGGIRGREIKLEYRDDVYDPATAEAAARALVDVQVMNNEAPHCPTTANPPVAPAISDKRLERGPNAVLAMLGNVGTPTMVRAAPVVVETGTVFFGAFTGAATILRDTACGECKKYIFNVRASYSQEARATLEFFKRKQVGGSALNYKNMISFDQNDTYGQAGYDGLVDAYKELIGNFPGSANPTNPIARFRYTRGDETTTGPAIAGAKAYLNQLLIDQSGTQTVGIMMTDTYGVGDQFIRAIRDWQFDSDQAQNKATRLKLYFSNVSFVGPNALAERLTTAPTTYTTPNGPVAYADGVVVSQVVPNYQSDTSDVVIRYNQLIAASGVQPSFTSLEGYIAGRIFIAGLEKNVGPFTPESLVKALEGLPDLGLGIGATAGFAADSHQYSQSVWGTQLQADGKFKNLYFWSQDIPIQFFE
ncbi:MAG: ABC transporter substrate-binding protein [Kofleriaceae bacterium]|nr:ABC transporter substrate-binding protein [Kofleriaceae bacterium]